MAHLNEALPGVAQIVSVLSDRQLSPTRVEHRTWHTFQRSPFLERFLNFVETAVGESAEYVHRATA